MASIASLALLGNGVNRFGSVRNAHPISCTAQNTRRTPMLLSFSGRRQLLFSLTAATVVVAGEPSSMAQDIPFFGLRKKLKKAGEEAVEIAKEGLETAEKGIDAAEKEIVTAEREIGTAAAGLGGLSQAGLVVGAEVVGVLVASSVVNGILGTAGQKS